MKDWYKNHLADSVEYEFKKAQKKFVSELRGIFKEDFVWKCFHGSIKGYYVRIEYICDNYADIGRAMVTNDLTHKSKLVSLHDLQEVKE